MIGDLWWKGRYQTFISRITGCRPTRRPRSRFLPWLEQLEERCTPTSVTLTSVADNTLYQDPIAGHLSNGAGQHMYAGDTNQASNDIRRALLKFDLSSIPAGATINSATLTLNMSKTNSGAQTVSVHRATSAWGEGASNAGAGGTGSGEGDGIQAAANDATWLFTFFNTQSWTTAGGDFVASASASTTVNGVGSYQWTGTGLTADVQQWLNNSSTNDGWVLTGNESTADTAKQFDTKENTTAANRPSLTINYTAASSADLTISKSHTGTFTQGDAADTYTIRVTNSGGTATSGTVTVSDTLPTGLTPTAADNGTIAGWNVSFLGQTITATRSDPLNNAASYPDLTLTVSVAGNAAASVTNTATVSGGGETNTTNDSASDPTTIIQPPDLTIAKSHTGNFTQGDPADTYSIIVTNSGTGSTSGTVTVADTLPTGLTPTAADSGSSNGWSISFNGQTITATRSDSLNSGASYPDLILTVSVANNAATTVTNTATVAGGGENNTGNDSASDPTTIVQAPDLTITKSHIGNFTQGDAADTYTITVGNAGSVPTSGTVIVSDTLPAGLTPTAADNGTINGWTVSFSGQTITAMRTDSLTNGTSFPDLTLTVSVADNASASLTNTATVSGGGETNTANDSASDPTTIITVNRPPVNTLPASFSGAEDTPLVLAGISVTDPDGGNASETVTFSVTSGSVALSTTVSGGVTAGQVSSNGSSLVVITAPLAAIDATLADAAGLTYTSATNASGSFTLNMTTDDMGHTGIGGPLTDTDTSSISISAVNDAPVNTLPTSASTPADTPLALTGVSISDVDAGSASVSVTLNVTNGNLAISTSVAGGISASAVTGNGSGLVTLFAPLAQIDATLAAANSLVFTPAAGFAGTATLTLVSNDLGNTGSGGPQSDTDTETITVTQVLDHFTIDVPAAVVAGVPFDVTVTARNQAGAVVGNFSGTVTVTTSDPQGSVPASATLAAGTATFQATLKSAGNQTISLIDLQVPSITAHATIPVSPGIATHLAFGQQPTTTLVAAPFLPAVSVVALDAFDNVATPDNSDAITVRLQNNPTSATLTGTNSVKLSSGVAAFPTLQLNKAGTGFTLVASSPTLPAVFSNSCNVVAVSSFSVTTSQATATAGTVVTVTVKALDAKGQVVTGYAGTVHFTSSDAQAVLPADGTLTQGQGSFSVTLKTAGSRTISVADLAKPTVKGALKKPVTVTAAAVSALTVTGIATPATIAQKLTVTVSAVDAYGNVNPSYRGTVTLSSTDSAAVFLPHSYTFVAKDAGKHPFSVTFNTPGLPSVTASDGSLTGNETNILVAGKTAVVLTQADPENSAKSALVVIGTSGNDTIDVSPTNAAGTQVEVRINNVSQGTTFAPTGRLLIYGLGGNDTIRLLAGTGALAGVQLAIPAVIDGGAGNDAIDASGSSANAVVLGGAGNDSLTGSAGRNILFGGAGIDVLHGGSGDDILVAGPTTFDANLAPLLSLMDEWGSSGTNFLTRVQHLSGTLTGGANAPFFLTGTTVPKDSSVDQLFGDGGSDWFLYTASGATADQVKDPVSGDVLFGM